ncbi:DUF262 domain-containing protein [Herbidospora sp. NBRC 101105]|uniref:DUF262 domain-containing protein n=1 Tax=Herbidospora sp. NBRC 101105 TaxID=3032195 RepID=UPI0024A1C9AC|nr:DUF262 domain-containing protein [Herbidospora sp. NBRC 101105]GLX98725.1 hypothetical protein Hesp01_66750 [Herbidospora sp. NBRC 101105]
MKKIDGVAKSVREILKGNKYSIDYYQREYKWESKQLSELVNDLTSKFDEAWDPSHARKEVEKYPYYFLGSIIISEKDGEPFVVDGQQRLTSLTLLLTYLRRLQHERDNQVSIDELIFSEKYGEKSFNLDVPDRVDCMEALYEKGTYDPPADAPESVLTLVERYEDLDVVFPEELRNEALPFFIDWLQNRVQIVQITAYADDDAYTIFETMNDRGLKLTPADMLKGYLLANIEDGKPRLKANDLWRKRLRTLNERSDDADADFLKTWLRSQYSTKIRERKKAAQPEDWDRIGTEFHRWLRGDHERVGLTTREDFYGFVVKEFDFYSQQYLRIVKASNESINIDSGLRHIRYNADHGFTLQDQLLLAPLNPDDDKKAIDLKLEIVGRYIDILLAWRIWNFRSTAYSTMQYAMFNVMRGIRRLSVTDLAERLHEQLGKENETFDNNNNLYLHQQNRSQLHRILARITDFVAVESGETSKYDELTNNQKVRYEVEHIWADHYGQHRDEFAHEADFDRHRNRIGDLILLPKSFNASYGDNSYEVKLPHYFGQNILAKSLNPQCYKNHSGFVKFVKDSGLAFRPHEAFKAADVVERGQLYREIAKQIWNPEDLLAVAAGGNW